MIAAIHLLAGLNGAGKSTHARRLERDLPAARFGLDDRVLRLHGLCFNDAAYPDVANRCRELIWEMTAQVLRLGSPVVLDWNAWSRDRRAEAVRRAVDLGVPCHLHHVRVPVETAIRRAADRRDPRSRVLSADDVRHLAELFEPPEPAEGFVLHIVEAG